MASDPTTVANETAHGRSKQRRPMKQHTVRERGERGREREREKEGEREREKKKERKRKRRKEKERE